MSILCLKTFFIVFCFVVVGDVIVLRDKTNLEQVKEEAKEKRRRRKKKRSCSTLVAGTFKGEYFIVLVRGCINFYSRIAQGLLHYFLTPARTIATLLFNIPTKSSPIQMAGSTEY